MSPLPLLVVVAVKVLGVVTPPAETWSICNDSNFTTVSVSIDICARIKIILQPCLDALHLLCITLHHWASLPRMPKQANFSSLHVSLN